MLSNPALPLRTLPTFSTTEQEAAWGYRARQACSESLGLVDALLATSTTTDRDIQACLVAIQASLQLVVNEPLSAPQIAVTVRRALQVFDRLAGIQSATDAVRTQTQSA